MKVRLMLAAFLVFTAIAARAQEVEIPYQKICAG